MALVRASLMLGGLRSRTSAGQAYAVATDSLYWLLRSPTHASEPDTLPAKIGITDMGLILVLLIGQLVVELRDRIQPVMLTTRIPSQSKTS